MIKYYETFDTKKEAEDYRDQLYQAYHPAGYGTHIRIEFREDKNVWVAWGSRAASCD